MTRRAINHWKEKTVIMLCFLIAWFCRFPPFNVSTIPHVGAALGLLRPLIYIGFCAAWCVSVSQSVINKRLRNYLRMMAFCCIFWLLLRTIKYELTFKGDLVNILLLYAYYIPFILLPTLGFFASLYARRGDSYNMSRFVHIFISLISLLALLFVWTNPLHTLYWTHPTDDSLHGAGYPVVMSWIALLTAMTIFNIVVRAKIPRKHAAAALPLIITGIIILYFAMLLLFPKIWKYVSSDWTSFTCLAAITLMQACISSGMIPSNKGYEQLMEVSDKGVIITDDAWNVCYASSGTLLPPKEMLRMTEGGTVKADRNTLLKGKKLHSGHVVWREDISDISAVLRELEENRRELTSRNELDKENTKTESALTRAEEKNRLYDASQQATAKQNKQLQETLTEYFEETDVDARRKLLVQAAALGAFVKRKGNLIFAGDLGTVKASELKLCFNESLNNIELTQADCHMEFSLQDDKRLPLKTALMLYDSFETAVEVVLSDLSAAFIRISEDELYFRGIYSFVSSACLYETSFPGEVVVEQDGETWIVSLILPKGGGRV